MRIRITATRGVLNSVSIGKNYDSFVVLKNINFSLNMGEKIGLVGPNGVGKSTLLKIIAGIESPSEGRIEKIPGVSIGYFPQEFPGVLSVSEFLENYSKELFYKFGFKDKVLQRKIQELSGGEKSRLALIKIMNSGADVFLLDEPTNNLDIPTLVSLEKFIRESNKAFLIISHDREFLDRIIDKTIELDEFTRQSIIYDGNYSDYLEKRQRRIEKEWAQYQDKKGEIIRLEKSAKEKENKAKKTEKTKWKKDSEKMASHAKKEKSAGNLQRANKALKKHLESIGEAEKPKSKLPLKMSFDVTERSGDKVFKLAGVVKKIGDARIGPVDLSVRYGDRILILGANGVGKTTLINILLGKVKPDGGILERGARLSVGHLPQESDFDANSTVIAQFMKSVDETKVKEGIARRLLNRFNLTEEDMRKKMNEISPGMKSRLMLAIMMTNKVNCLILDEPSNHLDLDALEKLEWALKNFDGTLILISHDRYFINRIGIEKTYLLKKGANLKNLIDYHEYEKIIG